MSNRDRILYISSSETTADITQVTPWGSQMPGTYVCRYGRSSLRVCGDIILNDDDRISRVRNSAGVILEQHLILGTVVYAADAIGGDSGGPVAVFTKEHDPNAHWMAALYGTHVHSFPETSTIDPNGEGWYSPVTSGIAEMQSQFGVTLAACTTDLCGLP